MIAEAATTFGSGSGVELGLVLIVGGMVYALVRMLLKAEHNQDTHKAAIEEFKTWKSQQQQTNESVNLRLDRLERQPDDRSYRTGRFPIVDEERDR